MLGVAVNNACWLITNKVSNREDIDRATKFGLGLKGGLFPIAEKFGFANIVDELRKSAKAYGSFYEPDQTLLNFAH